MKKLLGILLLLLLWSLTSTAQSTGSAKRVYSANGAPGTTPCLKGPIWTDVWLNLTTGALSYCSTGGSPGTWTGLAAGIALADSPTVTGAWTFSKNGALSLPTISMTGSWVTGGDATTTKPLFLVQPTGATSTGWSTNGTGLGINAASGFTGNLFDAQLNGVSKFNVASIGNVTAPSFNSFSATDLTFGETGVANRWRIKAATGNFVSVGASSLIGFGDPFDVNISRNAAGIVQIGTTTANSSGTVKALAYTTDTNCADSAGAAACGSATSGSFVIDAATTSTVVSTTAVTANSQIQVQEDSSLGTRLSVTCNTQSSLVLGSPRVTARTAGTSFTVTIELGPTTNPMCLNYTIVN